MKNLKDVVTDAISWFQAANKEFSAHDVTERVRRIVNSTTELLDIPRIEVNGKKRWNVTHDAVKRIVNDCFLNGTLKRVFNGTYFIYQHRSAIAAAAAGVASTFSGYISKSNQPAFPAPASSTLTVADRLRDIIVPQLGINAAKVVSTARYIEDLGADSLDTVEILMAVEEEFDIEINDADAEKLLTIGETIAFLEKELNKSTAAVPAQPNYVTHRVPTLTADQIEVYIDRCGTRTVKQIQSRFKNAKMKCADIVKIIGHSDDLYITNQKQGPVSELTVSL